MGCSHATSFCIVGQFRGYELKGHKIRYIHLCQLEAEYRLKLGSEARDDLLRAALAGDLQIGDWVEVSGLQEDSSKGGRKRKAHRLCRCAPPASPPPEPTTALAAAAPRAGDNRGKMKVLVCQKSSCCKRGGKAVMQQLQQLVCDRHLSDQVTIKGTGCMGKCSKGPVIVIDKTHYRQVQPRLLPSLIAQHIDNS